MRIAIPNFPSADSFVENVACTLRAMGHEVVTPDRPVDGAGSRLARIIGDARRQAFPQQWTEAEQWVLRTAKALQLDVVLCLTQAVRQEVLAALRAAGVRHLVAWWGDTPANMRGLGLLAPGWDAIFLKDAAAVAKFRSVGLDAELLHEAMNPAWHRRDFDAIGPEVVVAGSYYGFRQYIVARLLERNIAMALYGPAPPRWSDPAVVAAHRGRYIVKAEKSRVFGSALACLNSTALSEGDSLNCRAFEIAGACGLQLIEDKPSIQTCFEPGREVLTFKSLDEIQDHLDRALTDSTWALQVREAGYRRAHNQHTYSHRVAHIFRRLGLPAA